MTDTTDEEFPSAEIQLVYVKETANLAFLYWTEFRCEK